jgi:hypothetical protein
MEREDYISMVKNDGLKLADVPMGDRTRQVCYAAVKNNGWAFRHVPGIDDPFLRDFVLWRLAVMQDGAILYHVPPELKTTEICLIAVQTSPMAIEFVPKEIIESPGFLESLKGGLKLEETGEYCDALHVDDIGNYTHLFQ